MKYSYETVSLKSPSLLRFSVLFKRYRNRLRIHGIQELLAGLGIATAVALVFATLVASQNVASSASSIVHALVGSANLQVRARGNQGFDENVLARIERIPHVKRAADLLEQTGTIAGPESHHVTVNVIGAGLALARLTGLVSTLPTSILSEGIGLSQPSANALDIPLSDTSTQHVDLLLNGKAVVLPISAILNHETGGAVAGALIAVMPLAHLQQIAGLPKRVSRVLVQAESGHEAAVSRKLQSVEPGRLTVAPASQDINLLSRVLRPSNQASDFFAVIAGLLGFLFAFNAMLSTIPERRLEITDLRVDGTKNSAICQMVIFQALLLGVASSLVGLLGGYILLKSVFHESPGYLAQTFILSTNVNIWAIQPILLATMGGVIATCAASMVPLLDLPRRHSIGAMYADYGAASQGLSATAQRWFLNIALALLILSGTTFLLARSAALFICGMLALATVLAVPATLAGILRAANRIAENSKRLALLSVALTSLRATTMRSLALVATGAVALFGAIALGGSRGDLLGGLRDFAHSYVANSDIWVRNPGYTPDTTSFAPQDYTSRIAQIPGVRSVQEFHSEFINVGNRRIVLLARPPSASSELLRTQMIAGDPAYALERLRQGGWIVLSAQIAREQHVRVGGIIHFPTPTGIANLRLAGTTTNLTWPGGGAIISDSDYTRLWDTHSTGELGVTLQPTANIVRIRSDIASVLPSNSLEAITAQTWTQRFDLSANEGLNTLNWISTLLIVAAILAMASALTSATWQQRTSLAGRRVEGVPPTRLRRLLLVETVLMLSAGCVTGIIGGILGQITIDSYLRNVTGFPVVNVTASPRPFGILALVMGTVLVFAWTPRWIASHVPPIVALTSE